MMPDVVLHGDGGGRNKKGSGGGRRRIIVTRPAIATMTTTRPLLPISSFLVVVMIPPLLFGVISSTMTFGGVSALALVGGCGGRPCRGIGTRGGRFRTTRTHRDVVVPSLAFTFGPASSTVTAASATRTATTTATTARRDDNDPNESTSSTILDSILGLLNFDSSSRRTAKAAMGGKDDDNDDDDGWRVVSSLIKSLNSRDIDDAAARREVIARHFASDVSYVDMSSFYSTIHGREDLIRHLNLHAGSSSSSGLFGIFHRGGDANESSDVRRRRRRRSIVVDDIVSSSSTSSSSSSSSATNDDGSYDAKVCVLYHLEEEGGEEGDGAIVVPDTTAITFYNLRRDRRDDDDENDDDDGSMNIVSVIDVSEPPSPKPGDAGLVLLRSVSQLFRRGTMSEEEATSMNDGRIITTSTSSSTTECDSVVRRYFDAWNRRDVVYASSLFADDCVMRDLQYDGSFAGRGEFEKHLVRVADCLPDSFTFVVDDLVSTSLGAGAVWHVENDGATLPFTRGCSFYSVDPTSGLIRRGYEIPERAPPKLGYVLTLESKFADEPIRLVPALLWVTYMYVLFVSDGILPGASALALELRTWEEVRDLSINFFLVSPALHLPFSPVVHPMLEGVFNLLLAWAAMFAGFLSDEREDKPNLLPFGPMLVGMQFLTSGFLLPYLFTRTSERIMPEKSVVVYREDISGVLQREVAEWRPLGLVLGVVGTSSIVWGLVARPEYGDLATRYLSFLDLLSIDRVGSSFIVDLAIFAAFQGWFVDDDLRRRGVALDELMFLRITAKFVPFFGLVAYLTLRPPLPIREKD